MIGIIEQASSGQSYNTIIGGITRSEFESFVLPYMKKTSDDTAIGFGRLKGFTEDPQGNLYFNIDIQYYYTSGFYQRPLTYYIDFDGLLTSINNFRQTNLKFCYLPACASVGSSAFDSPQDGAAPIISLPSCTALGASVLSNAVFQLTYVKRFYTHISLATNNGGNPDGDIQDLSAYNALTFYAANSTKPNPVGLITIDDIGATFADLSWDEPSSSNTVDGYIVLVNSVYHGYSLTNSYKIDNLTAGGSYDVKFLTFDNSGNFSIFSQSKYFTTNTEYQNSVEDLALTKAYGDALRLNFTLLEDVAAEIDFYEVYLDGSLLKTTQKNDLFITGLNTSTSYEVYLIAVDINGVKHEQSNILNITTEATVDIPVSNIIAYYNYPGDVKDLINGNDGVLTSAGFAPGKVGEALDLTSGTAAKMIIPDAPPFQFGSNPFSVVYLIKFNSVADPWMITQLASNYSSGQQFWIIRNGGNLQVSLRDNANNTALGASASWSPSLNTWYQIGVSWTGGNTANSLKLYLDAVEIGSNSSDNLTFQSINNLGYDITVGRSPHATVTAVDGYVDELAWFNTAISASVFSYILNKNNNQLSMLD